MDRKTEEILTARTLRLARPSAVHDVSAESAQTLVVAHAARTGFAVDAEWVLAAVSVQHVATLPGLPATVAGLLNFRGSPLVAFHPSVVLQEARQTPAERTHALVVGAEQPEVALLVDDIEPPRRVWSDDICNPPDDLPEQARKFLRGVTPTGELILKIDVLLASDRLFAKSFLRRQK